MFVGDMPSWGKKNRGVGWLHPISFITWIQKTTLSDPTKIARNFSSHNYIKEAISSPSWELACFLPKTLLSRWFSELPIVGSVTCLDGILSLWILPHLLISAFIQKSSSHSSHHLPTLSCWCLWLELENPGIPKNHVWWGLGHLGCFGVCSHTLSSWLIDWYLFGVLSIIPKEL